MVGSQSANVSSTSPYQQSKKYGITKPISLAGPTEADTHRNMELEKVFPDYQLIDIISTIENEKDLLFGSILSFVLVSG